MFGQYHRSHAGIINIGSLVLFGYWLSFINVPLVRLHGFVDRWRFFSRQDHQTVQRRVSNWGNCRCDYCPWGICPWRLHSREVDQMDFAEVNWNKGKRFPSDFDWLDKILIVDSLSKIKVKMLYPHKILETIYLLKFCWAN